MRRREYGGKRERRFLFETTQERFHVNMNRSLIDDNLLGLQGQSLAHETAERADQIPELHRRSGCRAGSGSVGSSSGCRARRLSCRSACASSKFAASLNFLYSRSCRTRSERGSASSCVGSSLRGKSSRLLISMSVAAITRKSPARSTSISSMTRKYSKKLLRHPRNRDLADVHFLSFDQVEEKVRADRGRYRDRLDNPSCANHIPAPGGSFNGFPFPPLS